MNARDDLRDCFLSDSRDRFEAAADAYRAEVLREAAPKLRAALREMPAAARERAEEGMFRAALILEEMGIAAGKATPAPAAEPATYGRLDLEAKTWTHDNGHVMDLSHGWQDAEGRHWHWDNDDAPDPINGPYMRAAAYGLREPLDVVLAAWGPIVPVRRLCFECDRSYLPSAGVGPWCSTACRNLDDRHDNSQATGGAL